MEFKIKITNSNQFEKMVEELGKNLSLAKGFRSGTLPKDFKEQWESISKVLNSFGPPIRSADGWQKIWRDLKFKAKKKIIANKAECKATGGGRFRQLTLSLLEDAVANNLQIEQQISPEDAVQGVQCEVTDNDVLEEETGNSFYLDLSNLLKSPEGQIMETATSSTKDKKDKKKVHCNDQHELFQKLSSEQAGILTDIKDTMSSLKRSLRDFSKFQNELVTIEGKKLEIEKERTERVKEMHEAELKIKRITLSILENQL